MAPYMFWNLLLTVNSAILVCSSTFLVYSIGMLILEGNWRIFLLTLVVWVIGILAEMVLAALSHE